MVADIVSDLVSNMFSAGILVRQFLGLTVTPITPEELVEPSLSIVSSIILVFSISGPCASPRQCWHSAELPTAGSSSHVHLCGLVASCETTTPALLSVYGRFLWMLGYLDPPACLHLLVSIWSSYKLATYVETSHGFIANSDPQLSGAFDLSVHCRQTICTTLPRPSNLTTSCKQTPTPSTRS